MSQLELRRTNTHKRGKDNSAGQHSEHNMHAQSGRGAEEAEEGTKAKENLLMMLGGSRHAAD